MAKTPAPVGGPVEQSCFWRHRWGRYAPPSEVHSERDGDGLAQRRECSRCGAVDYRRVTLHN